MCLNLEAAFNSSFYKGQLLLTGCCQIDAGLISHYISGSVETQVLLHYK